MVWGLAMILAANALLLAAEPKTAAALDLQGTCGKRYVAGGDHVPAGHEVSISERFPSQLLTDHLDDYGWCLFNLAENETTSLTYITGSQLSQTWNFRPDLITLTVGEENPTIVNIVNSCFDKVKDHDFSGATACAAQILGNASLWTNLTSNLTTTLQQYKVIMAGRPQLVVALLGYPNPYPTSLSAGVNVPLLCVPLQDTIPTCTVRWMQLPPALTVIDQVFVKLNTTIQNALKPFQAGPSGNRYVYVDTYTPLRDHCMKMDVTIRTTVNHGPGHPSARLAARLRLLGSVVRGGKRRDEDPGLPRSRGHRHPRCQVPDHGRDGNPSRRRWPRVRGEPHLGGRYDRPGHDAAEVEAWRPGGSRHEPVRLTQSRAPY